MAAFSVDDAMLRNPVKLGISRVHLIYAHRHSLQQGQLLSHETGESIVSSALVVSSKAQLTFAHDVSSACLGDWGPSASSDRLFPPLLQGLAQPSLRNLPLVDTLFLTRLCEQSPEFGYLLPFPVPNRNPNFVVFRLWVLKK